MKKNLLLLAALALTSASSFGQTCVVYARKTLPLYEGFNYNQDDKLLVKDSYQGLGAWQMFSSTTTSGVTTINAAADSSDPVIAVAPTWNMGGLAAPTNSMALKFVGGSDDPVLNFTDQGAGDIEIYSSFIFKIESPSTDATDIAGEYFYSFGKTNSATNGVNYTSLVYYKRTSASANSFYLGIAENNSSAAVYSPTVYNFDEDIRIVIKYKLVNGDASGLSSMWINPVTTSSVELPIANGLVTTADGTSTSARTNLDKIRINKSSKAKTPSIIIDEIRVANTWDKVTGPGATLSTVKNEISGLNVYPNPVSNGVVYINSSSSDSKSVVVYDVLGKQLLQKVVTNGTLDVSGLNKGVYIMKVTEGNDSSTKKLVIE